MVMYNVITDTTLLSVLRYGSCMFYAKTGETLTLDVGKLPVGLSVKYVKVSEGILVEMNADEKIAVLNAEIDILKYN